MTGPMELAPDGSAPTDTAGLSAWAEIDLDAIADNVAALREHAGGTPVMAVVKGDAYGHGLAHSARAALARGASWLGVAQVAEALDLRAAGVTAPLLSWIHVPGTDLAPAVQADIDLSAGQPWALASMADAARATGRTVRVHLKVDTGLGRGGALGDGWTELLAAAGPLVAEGAIDIVGIWSHLAWADAPDHPTVRAQRERFVEAIAEAERAGIRPQVRHLANSAATLTDPQARFDLVRPGLAVYGLSPVPDLGAPQRFGLREAMRLLARFSSVKYAPAGQGVSYGHEYTTPAATRLGLVPIGYADGIPRAALNAGPVAVRGTRARIAGRVCMDQFVVDLGAAGLDAEPGEELVLFGRGADDEPTAQDWAEACGTINYEIVTRIGPRVPRVLVGTAGREDADG